VAGDRGRDAAFAVILSRSPRVLLVQKRDGRWGLPGGGIRRGESPREAVLRELREETGFRARRAALVGAVPRAGSRAFVFVLPKRRLRGRLLGRTAEILRQRWVKPSRARRLLTSGNALRLALALPFALRLVGR
jgi:8-oxo-dGTP pyrophosphatase MutT (NUDIX family)